MKLKEDSLVNILIGTECIYNEKKYVDGIYYSEFTGRLFEATLDKNTVIIKYTDNLTPRRRKITLYYFLIQKKIGCYEDIINYHLEGI
jgi:hypothetical protein